MEQFSFHFQRQSLDQLPARIKRLLIAAGNAAKAAYAPYSNFKVGAAALLANDSMHAGANHENASYPAGICAERALLATLNPTIPENKVVAIAITYLSAQGNNAMLSPCGICRQTIIEQQLAQGAPIAIYLSGPGNQVTIIEDAGHLLPFYFSSKNLEE